MTYAELRNELSHTAVKESLERSPNNFYNSLQRLIKSDKIKKWGERVYALEAFNKASLLGELEPTDGAASTGVPTLVIRVLTTQGPMSAAKVVEAVEREPEAPELFKRGTQGVYAALSRLHKRGDLMRSPDGLYSTDSGGLL